LSRKEKVLVRGYKELPIGAGGAWFSYAFGGGGGTVVSTWSWRSFRPVIDKEKCTECGLCELFCPDHAIVRTKEGYVVDYEYCKGCGICAHECRLKAIEMVKETFLEEF